MKETILYKWKKNGEKRTKEIDRKDLLAKMCSLMTLYSEDNVIATQMVEILPKTVTLEVDKDRYEDDENPKIHCINEEGKVKSITINKRHIIIWATLDKYFM